EFQIHAMIDHLRLRGAVIKLHDIARNALGDCNHRGPSPKAVQPMFEYAGGSVEHGFAPGAALEFAHRQVPGPIADVAGEDITAESAEALRMDDIESAINLYGHGQGKAQHSCERI